MDDEIELTPEEHAELWRQWVKNGPQGPISDEDAIEGGQDFPEEDFDV